MAGSTRIILLAPGARLVACANLVLKESVPGVKGIYNDECGAGVSSIEMSKHTCHVLVLAKKTCTKACGPER